mmetsp:Transcript_60445/g.141552  ORF Transcript_60445/g.141552 Transcript_60445/m.141552 type:complete len:408 (-) Transcript_60445:74-1297(-)
MPARSLEGVMVVVPSFTEGQDTNQPIVHRNVPRVPVLEAPNMADGIHRPGHMPSPHGAGKEAPQDTRQAAEVVQTEDGKHKGVDCVGLLQEAIEPLLAQVFGVGAVHPHPRALLVEEPAGMGPPKAIFRGVHIVGRVGGTVMMSMRGHPVDGMALNRQASAVGKEVLHDLWALEGEVGKLSMVRQRNAEHSGHDIADEEAGKGLPREVKWCEAGSYVDCAEEESVEEVLLLPRSLPVCAWPICEVPELAVAGTEEPLPFLSSTHLLSTLLALLANSIRSLRCFHVTKLWLLAALCCQGHSAVLSHRQGRHGGGRCHSPPWLGGHIFKGRGGRGSLSQGGSRLPVAAVATLLWLRRDERQCKGPGVKKCRQNEESAARGGEQTRHHGSTQERKGFRTTQDRHGKRPVA